ncbi:MAG: hypothetical protein WBM00_07395, partial [Solirubrobacterales bacterium]
MSEGNGSRGETPAGELVPLRERQAATFGDFLRATPGLARVAITAGLHGAARATDVYVNTASRVVRAAAQGEPAGQVIQEGAAELRAYARSLLGLDGAGGRGS